MEFFDQPAYSLCKRLLLLTGTWPFENLYKRIAKSVLLIGSALSAIIPSVNYSFEYDISTAILKATKHLFYLARETRKNKVLEIIQFQADFL